MNRSIIPTRFTKHGAVRGRSTTPNAPRSLIGDRSWSRLAAVALVCGLVGFAAAPALARGGELDQSQTAPPSAAVYVTNGEWAAQTFTAGIAGRLDQIDLLVRRTGNPGDLTVQIRNASGGVPGTSVLGSETVAQASIPENAEQWVSVTFDPTAPSVAGTQYAIVLFAGTGTGGFDQANNYLAGESTDQIDGDLYPGGEGQNSGDGGTSWQSQQGDLVFRTYVTPADTTAPVSTATPTPGVLAPGRPLISVTATATFKNTTGLTVGSVGPVRCFDTRGLNLALDASDSGSGVASITYSSTGAQPIAPTTVTALPTTVSITAPGVTTLNYAATDNAGNTEQPANSQTVFVGSGFACATPTPSRFAVPAHGSATVHGTAIIGRYTIPFTTTIKY